MRPNDHRGVPNVDWPLEGGSCGGDRGIFCRLGDCGWPHVFWPGAFLCRASN